MSVPALGDRRVSYLLVGGFNTALGLLLFAALLHWCGDTIGYPGALVATYAIAIGIGFELQRRLVFRAAGARFPQLIRYACVQSGSLALNAFLLPIAVEVLGLAPLPGQVGCLALTIAITYVVHNRFTFRAACHPA